MHERTEFFIEINDWLIFKIKLIVTSPNNNATIMAYS